MGIEVVDLVVDARKLEISKKASCFFFPLVS